VAASQIKIRTVESIIDEMQKMHTQVAQRAYEIFEKSGVPFGRELDHWLAAESELTWKPPIELSERNGCFLVKAAIPGIDPKDIDVRVTPDDLLIKADRKHEHREGSTVYICEFSLGTPVRAIRFSKQVNPDKTQAELNNGILTLTAEIAEAAPSREVEVKSSKRARAAKRGSRQS
jgi:HSP20 family protein